MVDFSAPLAIAKPLVSAAQMLLPSWRRLSQERQAGRMPFSNEADLFEQNLDLTLARMRGGNIDNSWWRNLLDHLSCPFITPDFLRWPALQEWLAVEQVAQDAKVLARHRILGADEDDLEARIRLRQVYATITGEHESRADGAIDVVVAILTAGYVASIPLREQPLAGLVQASAQETREGFEMVRRSLETHGPDRYVVETHSEHAEHALRMLLQQRVIDQQQVRQELVALAQQVLEGDLRYATTTVRAKILYWVARLHATQETTLPEAKRYLGQLRSIAPEIDTRIIKALILEISGEVDRALQIRFITCLHHIVPLDISKILAFLEANQDIVEQSPDLTSEKAWVLSHLGRWKEAKACNERLLEIRDHVNDLTLAINLAIQSGDWERFPVIINHIWAKRETLEPQLLMRLASLAAETDATPHRALELVKLAESKASEDASILVNAYSLAVQLGYENIAWMTRAAALSSDNGPVWQVSTRTLVEETMPRHHEQIHEIERNLLASKIPLHAAAHLLNQSLARLLLGLPRSNSQQRDGRKRALLPLFSGARQAVPIHPEWTITFDLTSLMVLTHLGLLKKTLNACQRIVLAPDTLGLLLEERRRVRFHQPSRVQEAEEIVRLIDQGHLQMMLSLPKPPDWLVHEVGQNLAELLESARIATGYVVHPTPIYKLQTFLEKEAELGEYAALIVSPTMLTNALLAGGLIDLQTYERTMQFLRLQNDKSQEHQNIDLLHCPLYLDELTIVTLQEAGILQVAGLDLHIHSSVRLSQRALIEENQAGDNLVKMLDTLRVLLHDALETEHAILMPRPSWHEADAQRDGLLQTIPTLAQILKEAGAFDAICVDDRFINTHPVLTDEAGRTVPIICILDLLRYLEKQEAISPKERQRTLHRLRQAGYALIPIEPDELEQYVRRANLTPQGEVFETAEMRLCRQTLMRIRSLTMVDFPAEYVFLDRLCFTCLHVIRRLWSDNTISAEHAVALSDWLWKNLMPSPLDWTKNFHELPPQVDLQVDLQEAFARHVAWLLQPMALVQERYTVFRNWVEDQILEPLLPANAPLLDRIAEVVRTNIARLSEEFGNDDASNVRSLSM